MKRNLVLTFALILLFVAAIAQTPAGLNTTSLTQRLALPGNVMPTFAWNNQGSWTGFAGSYYDGMALSNSSTSQVNGRQISYTCPYSAVVVTNVTQIAYSGSNARIGYYFGDSGGKLAVAWYSIAEGKMYFDAWNSATSFHGALGPSTVTGLNTYGTGFVTVKMLDDCTDLTWYLCSDANVCNYQLGQTTDGSWLSTPSTVGHGGFSSATGGQLLLDVVQWVPGAS